MKEHEKIFFRVCYDHLTTISKTITYRNTAREIIDMLKYFIPKKRMWYYLEKWSRLDFYDYGVCLDCGWLMLDKIPPRYYEVLKEAK